MISIHYCNIEKYDIELIANKLLDNIDSVYFNSDCFLFEDNIYIRAYNVTSLYDLIQEIGPWILKNKKYNDNIEINICISNDFKLDDFLINLLKDKCILWDKLLKIYGEVDCY